jgi:hypothetical protein
MIPTVKSITDFQIQCKFIMSKIQKFCNNTAFLNNIIFALAHKFYRFSSLHMIIDMNKSNLFIS